METPALTLNRLTVGFGGRHVLRDVSLSLRAGERVALLGPNGAGKTTLLRTLATLQRPLSGEAHITDADVAKRRRAARRRLGFLGHTPHLVGHLTARENLAFLASLYGVTNPDSRVVEVLQVVGLADLADRRARELSRGQLQRLSLAAAALHEPNVLLLDEPDASLDRDAVRALPAMLDALCPGSAVLLSTHDPEVAAQVAGRQVLVDRGRVIEEDSPAAASSEQPAPTGVSDVSFVAAAWSLLRKDALVEWRAREQAPALLAFALLITVLFDMAFVILAQADAPAVAAGVAWSTLLLVASLSGVRLFGSERDANTLTCLRLAPIDQSAVFVAKYVLLAAHVLAVGLVQLALLSLLLDLQLFQGGMLATLGLVAIALSAVTAMQSALALESRAREVLMPLLAVPLAIPVMLAGVGATLETLQGAPAGGAAPWLGLLAVVAAVFLSLSVLLYPHAVDG
ncbi:MAG: heme ABC exporter ATP-binding protein CcmA [Chloroflexi bacterium]|nr:heme ABC exporter ATP-binding protein CcmA [Chloroflexota bacterium]